MHDGLWVPVNQTVTLVTCLLIIIFKWSNFHRLMWSPFVSKWLSVILSDDTGCLFLWKHAHLWVNIGSNHSHKYSEAHMWDVHTCVPGEPMLCNGLASSLWKLKDGVRRMKVNMVSLTSRLLFVQIGNILYRKLYLCLPYFPLHSDSEKSS